VIAAVEAAMTGPAITVRLVPVPALVPVKSRQDGTRKNGRYWSRRPVQPHHQSHHRYPPTEKAKTTSQKVPAAANLTTSTWFSNSQRHLVAGFLVDCNNQSIYIDSSSRSSNPAPGNSNSSSNSCHSSNPAHGNSSNSSCSNNLPPCSPSNQLSLTTFGRCLRQQ